MPAPANRQDPLVVAAAQQSKVPAQVEASKRPQKQTGAETAKPSTSKTPESDVFDTKANLDCWSLLILQIVLSSLLVFGLRDHCARSA